MEEINGKLLQSAVQAHNSAAADASLRNTVLSERFVFMVAPEAMAELDRIAKAEGISKAAIARLAIGRWLRQYNAAKRIAPQVAGISALTCRP